MHAPRLLALAAALSFSPRPQAWKPRLDHAAHASPCLLTTLPVTAQRPLDAPATVLALWRLLSGVRREKLLLHTSSDVCGVSTTLFWKLLTCTPSHRTPETRAFVIGRQAPLLCSSLDDVLYLPNAMLYTNRSYNSTVSTTIPSSRLIPQVCFPPLISPKHTTGNSDEMCKI